DQRALLATAHRPPPATHPPHCPPPPPQAPTRSLQARRSPPAWGGPCLADGETRCAEWHAARPAAHRRAGTVPGARALLAQRPPAPALPALHLAVSTAAFVAVIGESPLMQFASAR